MRLVVFVVLGVLATAVFAVAVLQVGDSSRNALVKDIKKSMSDLKTRVAVMQARGAPAAEIKADMVATKAKVWGEAYALAAEKAKSRILR